MNYYCYYCKKTTIARRNLNILGHVLVTSVYALPRFSEEFKNTKVHLVNHIHSWSASALHCQKVTECFFPSRGQYFCHIWSTFHLHEVLCLEIYLTVVRINSLFLFSFENMHESWVSLTEKPSYNSGAKCLQDERCSRDHEADATTASEDKRGACELDTPEADCTYAVVAW